MQSHQQKAKAYCPNVYTVSDGVTSFSKKSSNAGRLYEIYAQGFRLFLYVRSAFWLTKHQAGQVVRRPFSIQQEIKTCLDVESWKWKLRLLGLWGASEVLKAKELKAEGSKLRYQSWGLKAEVLKAQELKAEGSKQRAQSWGLKAEG